MESSITLIKVGFVFLEENKRIFESEKPGILAYTHTHTHIHIYIALSFSLHIYTLCAHQ